VTVGNVTAAINSELIQHYGKVPEIQLFILLVKLWAKKCNVINAHRPIDGLSGYAVVMMCLYYLMDTKQIKFLDLTE
jgi:DNA polymerase sigma